MTAMTRTAWGLTTEGVEHWMSRAECRRHDPDMWSVVGDVPSNDNEAAIAICRRLCPVRAECLSRGTELHARGATTGMIYGGCLPGQLATPPAGAEDMVGVGYVAAALGVSSGAVRRWIRANKLPAQRTGNTLTVARSTVDEMAGVCRARAHGGVWAYETQGCRCPAAVAAVKAKWRARDARRERGRAKPLPGPDQARRIKTALEMTAEGRGQAEIARHLGVSERTVARYRALARTVT